ncbi:MAG: hypothetical protein EA353_02720 [Puniceicoccaceae bacterium]|nr:MAG: hypothetical protein EA353_02720 [Puniceicoccaceae bacterium]
MSTNNIYISKEDYNLLNHLLLRLSTKIDTVFRLRGELSRAIVLDESEVPDEAIGLGSHVETEDLETGEREAYTLTLPAQSDFDQGRLSILTPIGAGLLGYEEGDEIEWPTPGGIRRIRVLSVSRQSSL